jgi:hypothetical protein
MKDNKDLSTRLRDLKLEFQAMESELSSMSESDAGALREFRHSLDDLRMTAWTVSELINARKTERNPEVVRSFLSAERLRRFSQMMRDLSSDLEDKGFIWDSSGMQSLSESLSLLQARLSKLLAVHPPQFSTAALNRRPKLNT